MKEILNRTIMKLFKSPHQPSSSCVYQPFDQFERHHEDIFSKASAPLPIPDLGIRRGSAASNYTVGRESYDNDYMLVEINERLSKSADMEKRLCGANLDNYDRVPVDFSAPSGPTILSDPQEAGEILLFGESRAVYQDSSKIYGLAPCAIYRAEKWFHQDADAKKAERMLQRTGEKDGSFLIRVNQRNCLVLTMCHHQKIYNFCISCKVERHRANLFIERSHQFSNLVDLIKYYTKHQGLFLPCRLTHGVALRFPSSTKYGIINRACVKDE